MAISSARIGRYADLGDAWLRGQIARIQQKQLQSGRHFRLDLEALLDGAARAARAVRSAQALNAAEGASTDHIWRATIEAINHCAQLEVDGHAPALRPISP